MTVEFDSLVLDPVMKGTDGCFALFRTVNNEAYYRSRSHLVPCCRKYMYVFVGHVYSRSVLKIGVDLLSESSDRNVF